MSPGQFDQIVRPTAAARAGFRRPELVIEFSANVQPFVDAMQKITAAFTDLALKIAPVLRESLAEFGIAWQAPAPYRVKRGRGQRRNRRNHGR